MTVLFTSVRPLERAENVKAVFDAYSGEKEFQQMKGNRPDLSGRYSLLVTDEFVHCSPGKCIMLGHGIPGGKTYGLDQPNPYHTAGDGELLSYVITSSPATVPIVAKQSNVPQERVLPLGMPRTDALFGKSKGDGGTLLADYTAYLFAPTFRTRYPRIDWPRLNDLLEDGEMLFYKRHPVSGWDVPSGLSHVCVIPPGEPSLKFIIDCDALITDYSSILFDAHVAEKPVVLFEPGGDSSYLGERGMYYPYPGGYASRHCTTEEGLVEALRAAQAPTEHDREIRRIIACSCDGHSTERVTDLIRSMT